MNDEDRKERYAELAILVEKFNTALKDAENFATKHDLRFHIYPEYGMGGIYSEGGWSPSSQADC